MNSSIPNCCRKLAIALSTRTAASHFCFSHIHDWCSATFCGYRAELTIILQGEHAIQHAQELKNKLPDHEFSCGRYIVADCIVTAINRIGDDQIEVQIEALLIEE
jgi:hypothetical protein